MRKKTFPSLCFMVIGLLWVLSLEASAEIDISRLVQEAPPLETYGDVPAVIWQRHEDYGLLPDGAMFRDSLWVVMVTDKLRRDWPETILSVPAAGELKIRRADLFDPVSGERIRSVPYRLEDEKGYPVCRMDLGDADEAVLVLRFRQTYARRFSVDGIVELASDLPMWEGRFSVSVPQGSELYVQSNRLDPPKKTDRAGATKYLWTVYNLSAHKRVSLVEMGEPYLAFGLRSGKVPFLQYMGALEALDLSPLPSQLEGLKRIGDKVKAGKRLLRSVEGMTIPHSAGFIREEIPPEGPWTQWERTLLLGRWLEDFGWRSELVWLTFLPIGSNEPATLDNFASPALRLAPPGSNPWFYLPGQTVEPGEIPAALTGKTLYGGSPEAGLSVYSVDKGKTGDHRLTMEWLVSLGSDGLLSGELRLWVRNGWLWLFPDGGDVTWESLETVIPGISNWGDGRPKVHPMDYGYRIDLPVRKITGIPGGPGMLLRLPCLLPGALEDLASTVPPKKLKFPFVVEQKYSVSLPEGSRLLSVPPMNDRKEGELRFSESMRFNRKRRTLEGEEKIITWSSDYDDGFNVALGRMLGAWLRWKDLSAPISYR
ncbi:hypothetical protein L2W58_02890 [Dethiosulfovibrio sp. F2B]|uniref:hypothetical protein n=1 Tax=Dethiosulfovibrio faecalis TaxID=2720018 RepID=UPI001F24457C|nr:hypothetical protein [Dethiosulfovibrio faecalis]MCF4150737.1 hypothetical protein [Dethiosulfovibrio faecalis]